MLGARRDRIIHGCSRGDRCRLRDGRTSRARGRRDRDPGPGEGDEGDVGLGLGLGGCRRAGGSRLLGVGWHSRSCTCGEGEGPQHRALGTMYMCE